MTKRRKASGKPGGSKPSSASRSPTLLRLRKIAGEDAWEFLHPRCALDRAEDLEEVRKMIEAEETEIAVDELRWLLGGCSDFIDAHKALGELALLENDIPLARGHFGYAVQIGKKAIERAQCKGHVPYRLETNTAFHEAGKGLAYCLKQLGKKNMLRDVVNLLLLCDPSDPLGVRGMLDGEPK